MRRFWLDLYEKITGLIRLNKKEKPYPILCMNCKIGALFDEFDEIDCPSAKKAYTKSMCAHYTPLSKQYIRLVVEK